MRSKLLSIEFTAAELTQICTLVDVNQDEGWYGGRKDTWEKRNEEIKRKISEQLKRLEVTGKNTPK